jgi:hypothetical protein
MLFIFYFIDWGIVNFVYFNFYLLFEAFFRLLISIYLLFWFSCFGYFILYNCWGYQVIIRPRCLFCCFGFCYYSGTLFYLYVLFFWFFLFSFFWVVICCAVDFSFFCLKFNFFFFCVVVCFVFDFIFYYFILYLFGLGFIVLLGLVVLF